jgi:hypothetical protein
MNVVCPHSWQSILLSNGPGLGGSPRVRGPNCPIPADASFKHTLTARAWCRLVRRVCQTVQATYPAVPGHRHRPAHRPEHSRGRPADRARVPDRLRRQRPVVLAGLHTSVILTIHALTCADSGRPAGTGFADGSAFHPACAAGPFVSCGPL